MRKPKLSNKLKNQSNASTSKSKGNTNSIIGIEKTIPGAILKLQPCKTPKKNAQKKEGTKNGLLPINEFAKTNENFKKFADKRLKSSLSGNKNNRNKLKPHTNISAGPEISTDSQIYNTNPNTSHTQNLVNTSHSINNKSNISTAIKKPQNKYSSNKRVVFAEDDTVDHNKADEAKMTNRTVESYNLSKFNKRMKFRRSREARGESTLFCKFKKNQKSLQKS